jgi:carbon storage regulator
MLILTRKKGEKIIIDHTIEITVLTSSKKHIQLGIRAPQHIPIYRHELYKQFNFTPKN